MSMFDLEEDRLVAEIERRGARKIVLQMPDGLKNEGPRLARLVKNRTGAEVFVSASPAWGACDLSIDAAKRLKADLLVHYGHNEFLRNDSNEVSVLYILARSNHDVMPVVKEALTLLHGQKVGLATPVQHLHTIPEAIKILENAGFKVMVPVRGPWAHEQGQVLGCDYFGLKKIEPEVDSFLIIGSYFHALGAALAVEKPTIHADPYDGRVQSLEQDRRKIIRQRFAMVEKAWKANSFGILVSTKPGQCNPTLALNIQRELEESGRKAVMLYSDEILPEKLLDFAEIEVFVDTACPRLALDDPERFPKPILTRDEIRVVTGTWTWQELLERGLVRL